ncbi:MAG TPA: flagellar export chaperone FliS [Polyangiales bacterium]|nr:flagellar export chaperone FliS [Polyangiales bacterium]
MNGEPPAPSLFGHAAALYRRTRAHTAGATRLLLEVHDAAIACLLSPPDAESGGLLRAHALVSELQATLRPEHDAALADELRVFYDVVLHRIVDAYVSNDLRPLVPVVESLRELRSAWHTLSEQPIRSA